MLEIKVPFAEVSIPDASAPTALQMEQIFGKDRRRYRSYNIVEYDDRTFIVVVAFGIEGLLALVTCVLLSNQ